MSAKDPRKSIDLTLSDDLAAALAAHRRRRRARSLSAAARDLLRAGPGAPASDLPDGARPTAPPRPGRRRLRLQLEPELRARHALSGDPAAQALRLEAALRAALGLDESEA